MKKRFLNLCIMVVGMLALLMYGKEKESTIQDVNAEFHVAKEDDKYELSLIHVSEPTRHLRLTYA